MAKYEIELDVLNKVLAVLSTLDKHGCNVKFQWEQGTPAIDDKPATEARLIVKAVDPAHVFMINVKFDKEIFGERTLFPDEAEQYIFPVIALRKIVQQYLARHRKQIMLIPVMFREEKSNGIFYRLETYCGRSMRCLITDDPAGYLNPKIPTLSLPVRASIDTADFLMFLRYLDGEGLDHMVIEAIDGQVWASTTKDDKKMANEHIGTVIATDEVPAREIKVKSIFSQDIFLSVLRAIPLKLPLFMHLGNDFPCQLEYQIPDSMCDFVSVQVLIAPRIENDG